MRQILRIAAFLSMLLPGLAAAQCNSSTPLPANTVLGRLGVSSGPCQAIPMSVLGPSLITSNLAVTAPLSISGLNLSITGSAGRVLAGASPAFTAAPTLGVAQSLTGTLTFANVGNSGTVTLTAPATATTWTFKFPTTAGSNGQALITDGSGNTSWAAGSGTVNSGTAGQLGYYATSAAALSGNSNLNISSGALTIGQAGSVVGSACFVNATSGSVCLQPTTGALSAAVATLPAGTYNVVGDTLTQTLSGKTLTAPTINNATMVAPALGAATATSINKVAITAPATGSTLTIADGKTLTDTSGIGASVLLGATGGGFTAYAGGSCTNQFIRSLSVAAAPTCATVANADLANSSITIGSTNVALGATASTVAGLTLTAPTVNGGTAQALTNLGIRSSGSGAFDMVIANTENLTAQRALTVTLNNAARAVNLSGDLTTAAAFTTAGGNPITLTATSSSNVTLPTSGTLAARDIAQTFSGANTFSALQQFTDVKFSSGKLYPTADSTTAMQFCQANATTCFGTIDTTNQAANFSTLKFTTLDPASLGTSTTTVTGLTVNNSPSSSNDYIPYYSAADGRIRKATVGSIAAGATAGVSSFNGLTGGLSAAQGNGVQISSSVSTITFTAATVTPQVRLSLTSATAYPEADVTGVGTIYAVATGHNWMPIYDGTNVVPRQFNTNTNIILDAGTHLAGEVRDIWAYWTGSAVAFGIGPSWATGGGSTTARGTGAGSTEVDFTTVPGLLTNKNAIVVRNNSVNSSSIAANQAILLGTVGIAASAGTTADSAAFRLLSNLYNPIQRSMFVTESTASWTYSTNAFRQVNANTANQIDTVQCVSGRLVMADTFGNASHATATFNARVGIGIGSTTVNSANVSTTPSTTSGLALTPTAAYRGYPGLGRRTFVMLENGLANSSGSGLVWAGSSINASLTGWILN